MASSLLASGDGFVPLQRVPGQTCSGRENKAWFSPSPHSSEFGLCLPRGPLQALPALLVSSTALKEASGSGIKPGTANTFTSKVILTKPPADVTQVAIQPPRPCPRRDSSEPTAIPLLSSQRVLREETNHQKFCHTQKLESLTIRSQ